MPEDERAQAFWDAPFAVLVQDDSKEACLEYANAAALRLLQADFEDVFDKSSFDVVHPDPDVQQVGQGALSQQPFSHCVLAQQKV